MKISVNNLSLEEIGSSEYVSIYYSDELSLTICRAEAEYIPIDSFRKIFLEISAMASSYPMKHFIFDKRALRTFHQPSMEWYFTIWKLEIAKSGLTSHFKILPDLEWFREAVNAGKNEILLKHGPDLLAGIKVQYVNDIEEAVTLAKKDIFLRQ